MTGDSQKLFSGGMNPHLKTSFFLLIRPLTRHSLRLSSRSLSRSDAPVRPSPQAIFYPPRSVPPQSLRPRVRRLRFCPPCGKQATESSYGYPARVVTPRVPTAILSKKTAKTTGFNPSLVLTRRLKDGGSQLRPGRVRLLSWTPLFPEGERT